MYAKQVSHGLGWFSIGLGVFQIFGAQQIAKRFDAYRYERVIKAFGMRGIGNGVALLGRPERPALMWGRVAGDALDLASLGTLAAGQPRNRFLWGAIAFVAGAAVVDVLTARALDRDADAEGMPDRARRAGL